MKQPVARSHARRSSGATPRAFAQPRRPEMSRLDLHDAHCARGTGRLTGLVNSVQSSCKKRTEEELHESIDLITGALLVVGGLNWGLVAIAEFTTSSPQSSARSSNERAEPDRLRPGRSLGRLPGDQAPGVRSAKAPRHPHRRCLAAHSQRLEGEQHEDHPIPLCTSRPRRRGRHLGSRRRRGDGLGHQPPPTRTSSRPQATRVSSRR